MVRSENQRADLSKVGVVIPALDEEAGLARLLPALVSLGVGQIVVGDNGSTDDTAGVARREGATVATAARRGYGAACWAALEALSNDVAVVVFIDADVSDDPALLPDLVAPILADEADLVVSRRVPLEPGALNLPQRFGTWLATRMIRLGWRFTYHDLGPFRAIRRSALDAIGMRDRAYGWTIEMQIRAVELGLRIREIDVPYRRRVGRSKISGTARGVALAAYWILSTVWGLWLTRRRRRGKQSYEL